MPFRLFDLPTEIVTCIIEQVLLQEDLRSLALACKRTQPVAETLLYRSILIRAPLKLRRLLDALDHRPQRAKAVRSLQCPCLPGRWTSPATWAGLHSLLKRLVNLKHISFESPECNSTKFEGWADWLPMREAVFDSFNPSKSLSDALPAAAPFQNLKVLVIHMNGHDSPYWDLNRTTVSIFKHPTLEELTISCVNITTLLDDIDLLSRSTPLRQLTLDECNIMPGPLKDVLTIPRALECLHLGENCFNLDYFGSVVDAMSNHLFSKQATSTIEALCMQKHSLRSLTYATNASLVQRYGYVGPLSVPFEGSFADFERLDTVSLVGYCPNFEKALVRDKPPPELKHLALSGSILRICDIFSATESELLSRQAGQMSNPVSTLPFLSVSSSMPSTLQSLSIIFDAVQSEAQSFQPTMPVFERDVRSEILTAGQACERRSILLKVFWKPHSRYIPPILYGERDSKAELLYASDGSKPLLRIAGLEDEEDDDDDDDNSSSDTDTDDSWEDEEMDEFEDEEDEFEHGEGSDDDDNNDTRE